MSRVRMGFHRLGIVVGVALLVITSLYTLIFAIDECIGTYDCAPWEIVLFVLIPLFVAVGAYSLIRGLGWIVEGFLEKPEGD